MNESEARLLRETLRPVHVILLLLDEPGILFELANRILEVQVSVPFLRRPGRAAMLLARVPFDLLMQKEGFVGRIVDLHSRKH